MIDFLAQNLIWTQAFPIVAALLGIAVLGVWFYRPLLYVAIVCFAFCLLFFRNPERICKESLRDPHVIVCPADGRIVDISHDPAGGFHGYHHKISIFLSPFDVHVNWTPITGRIEQMRYIHGTFVMAFLPKSSEFNEHNDILIRREDGKSVMVRQIAGMIARRICCWVELDQFVPAGYKYGMIKFSSRVDLFLPEGATIDVSLGSKVYGGQTVIGRLA